MGRVEKTSTLSLFCADDMISTKMKAKKEKMCT